MKLYDWYKTNGTAELERLANDVGVSLGYLRLIALGYKDPSAKLAIRIEKATSEKVSKESLRADIFGEAA